MATTREPNSRLYVLVRVTSTVVLSPMVTLWGAMVAPSQTKLGSAKSPGCTVSASANVHTEPVGMSVRVTACAGVTFRVPDVVGPFVSVQL